MRIAMIVAGLALVAAPAFANEAAPKPDDKERVVCKKERPTGSRIPTRVCMTKAEWESASDASQEALRARGADRNMLDNRTSNPGAN